MRRVETASCRLSWAYARRFGAAALAFLLCIPSTAATLTVSLDGAADYASIHAAIDVAVDGDTVLVKPGEYVLREPVDFRGKAIVVVGEDGARSTLLRLDAPEESDRASLVVFRSGEPAEAILEGFTLTGGRGTRNCGACPRRGGAIYCADASPHLRDLVIRDSHADFGGGIYLAGDAEPAVSGCVVEGNTASIGGGVCIASGSRAELDDSTIAGNGATTGGGIHASNAAPTIDACRVRNNIASADDDGGGLYLGDATRAEISACEIERNVAGAGGGISCVRASARFERCTIRLNRAVGSRVDCDVETGGESACLDPGGGGLRCLEASPEFISCRISTNAARQGDGGGVQLEFSSPTFVDCVLANNVARRGGALFASVGEPVLNECTVAWNAARGGWLGAGGLVGFGNASPIRVENSLVWANAGGPFSGTVDMGSSCTDVDFGEGFLEDVFFCGWRRKEIFVDSSARAEGDGSPERPYRDLADALDREFSLTLRRGAPCDGFGIGADLDGCTEQWIAAVTVHLAAGSYESPWVFGRAVHLRGAGRDQTFLNGTLHLTSTESRVNDLTVTGGAEGGVIVAAQRDDVAETCVDLRGLTIRGNDGPGVWVGGCDRRSVAYLEDCVVRDNDGPGVESAKGGSVRLDRCTVAGNRTLSRPLSLRECDGAVTEAGGVLVRGSDVVVNSIVWNNAGPPVNNVGTIIFSAIEGGRVGEGNIDGDPGFCGWPHGPALELDGDVRKLTEAPFELSLAPDSPCLGAGEGGVDMGADLGVCEEPGSPSLRVRLGPGSYAADAFDFAYNMSLDGAGAGDTVLEGRVGGLRSGTSLSHVAVTGGLVTHEAPRIEDVDIAGSATVGLRCLGTAAPEVVRCTIRRNGGSLLLFDGDGVSGGVVCEDRARPLLVDCVIRDNQGVGVWCAGSSVVTLEQCTIAGTETVEGPYGSWEGGVYLAGAAARVNIANSIVWNNSGRAIALADRRARATLSFSCIEGGWTGEGNIDEEPRFCGWPREVVSVDPSVQVVHGDHAIYAGLQHAIDPALFTLSLAQDSPCVGTGRDGTTMGAELGICEREAITRRSVHLASGGYRIDDRSLVFGVSLHGPPDGEAALDGTVRGLRTGSMLERLSLSSVRRSPIIVDTGQAPLVRDCRVFAGGEERNGIFCGDGSSPVIERCAIVGGTTGGSTGIVAEHASPTIIGSTIVGYESALVCRSSAAPTVVNSLLTGGSFSLRVILAYDGAQVELVHSTVIAAPGSPSIGAQGFETLVTVRNSIVVGPPLLWRPTQLTADHSLIQARGPEPVWPGEGNINGDPLFVDPAGGDFRLLPGSLAIDGAASGTDVLVDIDGHPRPCGAAPDMGAYEMGGCGRAVAFLRGDCNSDGEVNLSDAVCILENLFLGRRSAVCARATNVNGDASVDVADPIYLLGHLFGAGLAPPGPFPECGPSELEVEQSLGCAAGCL